MSPHFVKSKTWDRQVQGQQLLCRFIEQSEYIKISESEGNSMWRGRAWRRSALRRSSSRSHNWKAAWRGMVWRRSALRRSASRSHGCRPCSVNLVEVTTLDVELSELDVWIVCSSQALWPLLCEGNLALF